MTREITPETLRLCAAYKSAVSAGSDISSFVGEWATMLGVQRPAIWRRLRSGGCLPPYAPRQDGGKGRPIGGGIPGYSAQRRAKTIAVATQRSESLPPAVSRDPCPRCGVRSDLGCRHHPVRLLTGCQF